ncbi:MAG: hypothetical protein IT303_14875 [Dehalococcoidia bacterium]|nr:hypothetical protein [Dehalococcoidia bacterium]
MDTTTAFSPGQLVLVVVWNAVFAVPLVVFAARLYRRRAAGALLILACYAGLLLVLPGFFAAWVDYDDGSEAIFELVALYFAAWLVVALAGGLLLLPLAWALRRGRAGT